MTWCLDRYKSNTQSDVFIGLMRPGKRAWFLPGHQRLASIALRADHPQAAIGLVELLGFAEGNLPLGHWMPDADACYDVLVWEPPE
jgi:hypothetical protein